MLDEKELYDIADSLCCVDFSQTQIVGSLTKLGNHHRPCTYCILSLTLQLMR